MKGDLLPAADNVVRYVRPTNIGDDGTINGSEFRRSRRRPDDPGLSVNWLEYFAGGKEEQLSEIRRLRRLVWRASGRLAELNVGATTEHLLEELPSFQIVEHPLVAEGDFDPDPSHAEMIGLPQDGESEFAELIGDMIVECVIATYAPLVPDAPV